MGLKGEMREVGGQNGKRLAGGAWKRNGNRMRVIIVGLGHRVWHEGKRKSLLFAESQVGSGHGRRLANAN